MNVVYVCVSHEPEKSFDQAGAICTYLTLLTNSWSGRCTGGIIMSMSF